MQFNDTTNNSGICQEIDSLCDTNTTSYPLKDKTRRVNTALETVISWIINADGTWDWDDTNNANFPIGTYTLVNAQAKYSFNDLFLQLQEIQIMDVDGNYHIIKPIDQREFSEMTPLEEAYKTNGMPIFYDKISDDTIKLFPAPDNGVSVTLASGLKIKFKRTAHLFVAAGTDTTAVPGFASPFHVILAFMASIPYCMTYKKDRVALYEKRVDELKQEIIKFYSQREKDKRKIMSMKSISFR